MLEFKTYRDAFAHFGVDEYLRRACWSARQSRGSLVVLTFWDARRQWSWDEGIYNLIGLDRGPDGEYLDWVKKAGNTVRKRHVEAALAVCRIWLS